ncbi:MAG: SIMPL domain-containing protein [Minicystis sp.]
MSPRKYLKHLGLLSGLVIGSAVLAPSGASADEDASAVPLIVVQGSGEVRVRPDSLTVDVGVEARAQTLDQARSQVNATMTRVLEAVKALDLPDLTTDTRILQVSPVYGQQRDNQTPRIVGYTATNHVAVTIKRVPIEELGNRGSRILDTALGAGANSISGMDFFLADPTPVEDEALASAVRDAQRDARTIASAAGVTLGSLQSIEESPGMRIMPRALRLEMPIASTPIEVDDIVVTNNVTAKFTFH